MLALESEKSPSLERVKSGLVRHMTQKMFGVLILLITFASFAYSQETTPITEIESAIETANAQVERLRTVAENPGSSDAELASAKVELGALSKTIFDLALKVSAHLTKVDSQLTGLGTPPESGAPPEAETVTEARNELQQEKATALVALKDAEGLAVSASNLLSTIAKVRSENFTNKIFTRQPISRAVIDDLIGEYSKEFERLQSTFANWFRLLKRDFASRTLPPLMISLVFGTLVWVARRTVLAPLTRRGHLDKPRPYLSRLFSALWTTLIPSVSLAITLGVLYFTFLSYSLLPFRVKEIFGATLTTFSLMAFVLFLSNAVLAPGKIYWRLFNIPERAASRLNILIGTVAFVFFGDYLFAEIREAMSSPVSFSIAANFVSTLVLAALFALILLTNLNNIEAEEETGNTNGWAHWIFWPMWVAIIVVVVAVTTGYISFARFLTSQIVITGGIIVAMYVCLLSSREVGRPGALGESAFGSYLGHRFNFGTATIDQLGLLLGILIFLATLLIGIPLILLQWGFQQDDVQNWFTSTLGEFRIGDTRISSANIFLAVIVFIAGVFLTRVFQRWLSSTVLARTRIDSGLKNSISAGAGYIGFIIAALVALSYTGIDLTSLTLIVGALSVGIGFGLQNVVNNFVSGIILLIERPIRVGDWVVVGNTEGFVKKISVRATQLETFDKQSIVVPNAELINTTVGNWMLKDKSGRLIVEVGVSYDANEEEVRDILLKIAKEDQRIAANPEPYIHFKDFGDNAMIFQVRVFLKDVSEFIQVAGDMRFRIRKEFRDANIVIPYPQRDIHIQGSTSPGVKGNQKGRLK